MTPALYSAVACVKEDSFLPDLDSVMLLNLEGGM